MFDAFVHVSPAVVNVEQMSNGSLVASAPPSFDGDPESQAHAKATKAAHTKK